MGRRSGFSGLVTAIARAQRASVAAHNRAVRAQQRAARAHERAVRQHERALAAHNRELEREAKRQHLQDQLESADDQTAALAATIEALDSVLSHTLEVDDRIDFDSLRLPVTYEPFQPEPHLARVELAPQLEWYVSPIEPPGFFARLIPGSEARHQEKLREARYRFEAAALEHAKSENARTAALNAARQEYERRKAETLAEAQQRNAEVDRFEAEYVRGDVEAIVAYNTMLLERSEYPVEMPQDFRLEYDVESRELVIDYELPDATIIPAVAEVRYVKSKDAFEEKPRRQTEIRERHQKLVAAIALRSMHEVFEADRAKHLDAVTFSGFVRAVDPATGQDTRDYVVTIRASRSEFAHVDLRRVDAAACIRKFAISTRVDVTKPVPRRRAARVDSV